MAKRVSIDWEAVERDYRAGVLSVCEIARRHGASRQGVQSRARRYGWERDLTEDVRRRTRQLAAKDAAGPNAREDAEIIEQAAETAAGVVQCHRRDVRALREHCGTLLAELQEGGAGTGPESLRIRAGVLRDLSQAMSRLVPLERQAYSLDPRRAEDSEDGTRSLSDDELEQRIQELQGAA